MGKQSVFRSIPHDSNDCPWALLMVIANRPFPVPVSRSSFTSPCFPRCPRCSCVPVSRSSFIFPVSRSSFVSRCPGLYIHSFFSFVFLLYFFPFFFFFSLFRFLDFLVFLLFFIFFFFFSFFFFFFSFFFTYVLVVIYTPCVPVLCWLLIEHSFCPGRFLFECRHLFFSFLVLLVFTFFSFF